MKVHELKVKATPANRRRGRGIAAGLGKTAGRGTKGQNSRTGGGVKIGFEGGQTKFSMRLPKNRGFKAKNRTEYSVISTSSLEGLKKSTISIEDMVNAGIVRKNSNVKLLFAGDVKKPYTVSVDAASKQAVLAIEKAGGKVNITKPKREKLDSKTKPDTKENSTK
jgi:large subunit ribosomal protein L15